MFEKTRPGNQPRSWLPAQDKYNVGDTKEFTDGSTRRLDYSPSGVRRWLSVGKDQGNNNSKVSIQNESGTPVSVVDAEIPEDITIEGWEKYNEYLDKENPFRYSSSYNDVLKTWFVNAYEYGRREGKFEENIERLNNQCLAVMMYKISTLVFLIEKYDEEFDYFEFYKENNDWNELFFYYEKLLDPQIVDFTELYEDVPTTRNE